MGGILLAAFLFGGGFIADQSPVGLEERRDFKGGWFESAGFKTHRVPAEAGFLSFSLARTIILPRVRSYKGLFLSGASYGISVYQPKLHAKTM